MQIAVQVANAITLRPSFLVCLRWTPAVVCVDVKVLHQMSPHVEEYPPVRLMD